MNLYYIKFGKDAKDNKKLVLKNRIIELQPELEKLE
jgi:hypothetical protein